MAEASTHPAEPARRRRRWQVSVRTLILLTAAVAVWMTDAINRREAAALRERVGRMRPLARELDIADPTKVATVKLHELWYDENRWDVYLPPGRYRLCLATHEVTQDSTLPPVAASAPIAAGRHNLALEREPGKSHETVRVLVDGAPLVSVEERLGWTGHGSSGGSLYTDSTQFPADRPIVLFHRVFMEPDAKGQWTTPTGPSDGIVIWIEPVAGPAPAGGSE